MVEGGSTIMEYQSGPTRRPVERRWVRRTVVGAVLALLGVLTLAGPSAAHSGEQSYLYLDVTESSLGGRVEIPYADLREVLGFELDGDGDELLAELESKRPVLEEYLERHLAVGWDGNTWPIVFDDIARFESDLPEVDLDYAVIGFTADVDGEVPRVLDVRFDPFVDEIDGRSHLLLIANDWRAGVIDNGSETLLAFDADNRTEAADLGDASALNNLWSSVKLGIQHIETGPDHILFVLVLLLPSVLVWRSRWLPVDDFGAALWRILKIVTMFTIAHSITFTLAGLGALPLPSPGSSNRSSPCRSPRPPSTTCDPWRPTGSG